MCWDHVGSCVMIECVCCFVLRVVVSRARVCVCGVVVFVVLSCVVVGCGDVSVVYL